MCVVLVKMRGSNKKHRKKIENPKVGIRRFSGPNFFLPWDFFHGIYQINRGWNYTIFACENDGIPRLELTSFKNSGPKTAKFLPWDFSKIPIRKRSYSDPNFKIPRLGSCHLGASFVSFISLGLWFFAAESRTSDTSSICRKLFHGINFSE